MIRLLAVALLVATWGGAAETTRFPAPPARVGAGQAPAAVLVGTRTRGERVHVSSQRGTLVAVSIAFPVGAVHETPEEAGVTQLAAHALVESLAPRLDSLGARVRVGCGRSATSFTMLAAPDRWRDAFRYVVDALAAPTIPDDALESARTARAATARLDNGNPTWQIRVVTRQALFGVTDPRARPVCGLPETIELVHADTVRARARSAFRLGRAAVAALGPVERGARDFLEAGIGPGETADTARDVSVRDDTRAAERNTITAWTGLAFPVRDPVDETALRLLGQHVRDAIGPAPDRTGVLGVATEVERHTGGGALYVYFLSEPESAPAWADRVRERVERVARAGLPEGTFPALLRRFRGMRLLELETPEARAREAADRLLQGRAPAPLPLDDVDPSVLQQAAARLGAPARGFVGPAPLLEAVLP